LRDDGDFTAILSPKAAPRPAANPANEAPPLSTKNWVSMRRASTAKNAGVVLAGSSRSMDRQRRETLAQSPGLAQVEDQLKGQDIINNRVQSRFHSA